MSDGGMTPSQFQILREDFQAMRLEFQAAMRELVTRDAFTDERRRVDGRFKDQSEDIGDLRTKLEAESTARAAAELAAANAARASAEKANQVQKQTNWQWFLVFAGPIVAYLVGWIGAGGLAP